MSNLLGCGSRSLYRFRDQLLIVTHPSDLASRLLNKPELLARPCQSTRWKAWLLCERSGSSVQPFEFDIQ